MEEESKNFLITFCYVLDLTPNSQQRKITIIIRPSYTVEKIINDLKTLYSYPELDLILQPTSPEEDLVFLNDLKSMLVYKLPGFNPKDKNTFILLQSGQWSGNVKKRFNTEFFNTSDELDTSTDSEPVLPTDLTNTATNEKEDSAAAADDINGQIVDSYKNCEVLAPSFNPNLSNLSPLSNIMGDIMFDYNLALGASASLIKTEEYKASNKEALSDYKPIASATVSGKNNNTNSKNKNFDNETKNVLNDRKIKSGVTPIYASFLLSTPYASTHLKCDGFVGLVNQAMTCYLNSLLQSLYMTPEFRNAVYRWEFDNMMETRNISFQLQKLFLRLQISKKNAVETTDLTRSFGWNSTEAWQQHDIQELCRVLFDALEQKFRNTSQDKLIASLYEGIMIDYVRCVVCNIERNREDTFLDVPLSVRNFSNNESYNTVEESINAFVTPETLEGSNQYYCDTCKKKCDAYKGLKFLKLPYILTLHMKRFDFDHVTMQRVKLNDSVSFPNILDLSTLPKATKFGNFDTNQINNIQENVGDNIYNTTSTNPPINDNLCNGDVAPAQGNGDMSSGDKTEQAAPDPSLVYELFAIMIHSGSTSGGHYFAYIKDFDSNDWYNFNDQTVEKITEEDIAKSYGSKSPTGMRSSSGMTAYMIMYRKIDPKRNENFLKEYELPDHCKKLAKVIRNEEEQGSCAQVNKNERHSGDFILPEQAKPRVHFYNPMYKRIKVTRLHFIHKLDLNVILESAYQLLDVTTFASLENCRLVAYNPLTQEILRSFENVDDPLTEMRQICGDPMQFLLEYRTPEQVFDIYEPYGITWQVYVLNTTSMGIDGPFLVYSQADGNNDLLRGSIARRLLISEKKMLVFTTPRHPRAFVAYDSICTPEAKQYLDWLVQTYFRNITYLFLNVPNTSENNLEILGININNNNNKAMSTMDSFATSQNSEKINENLSIVTNSSKTYQECNSDINSINDRDPTLLENTQKIEDVNNHTSNTTSQLSTTSSPDNNNDNTMEQQSVPLKPKSSTNYFYAIEMNAIDPQSVFSKRGFQGINEESIESLINKPIRSYKIFVNSLMKLKEFKLHIERLIHVPSDSFILCRKNYKTPSQNATIGYFNEGETINVELCCKLKPNEYSAKVFYFRLDELSDDIGRLEYICEWVYKEDTTAINAKELLVAKFKRINVDKFKTLNEQNCRLWLKGGRNLIKIYDVEDKLCLDVQSSAPLELIVQECEKDICPQPPADSLVLFVRQWYPEQLKLGIFEEILLTKNGELRNTLSALSNIPAHNISYSKALGNFPNTNMSMLSVHTGMSWFAISVTMDKYPLTSTTNGNVFFYRDSNVSPKELTTHERCDFSANEKMRLVSIGATTYHSPRRDRSLKICTDSNPPINEKASENNTNATTTTMNTNISQSG